MFGERLPKDYLKESSLSLPENNNQGGNANNSPPVQSLYSPSEPCDSTFNIKSKVDTVPRSRRLELSRNGRRQILRAGSCFDKSKESERLLLTGTLPGTGNKAHRALAQFSSYASKTLTNWLTRRSPSCHWMYTWEFQKRGALHIHLVVELPAIAAAYVKKHFKDEWNRILRAICKLSGEDLYAKTKTYSHSEKITQADVTICTREPSRYISKYISKASTHAKAFGRFPPKTWYQISRSLLKALRDRTETFECEGLSYGQARKAEEDIRHYLSTREFSGFARFTGLHYSWSGYCFSVDFSVQEIFEKLTMKNQCLMSTSAMASMARTTMKSYPGGSCYVKAATHPETLTLMEKRMLSETELLMYVEAVTKTLVETFSTLWNNHVACQFLKSVDSWYLGKFGYSLVPPELMTDINKICKDYLTDSSVRTKVETKTTNDEPCQPTLFPVNQLSQ